MSTDGKKGITVKIDAELHAEVKQYLESHDMTMAEFVTLALDDELHPKFNQKEEKNMDNMRTIAFQVPEDLFYKIKDYLQRNNMTARTNLKMKKKPQDFLWECEVHKKLMRNGRLSYGNPIFRYVCGDRRLSVRT